MVNDNKEIPKLHEDWIHPDAIDIVESLQRRGHEAYLVGGCVRDLLLGKSPKDYDIATSAKPQEVRSCVRNAYIIGKRFRLVLAKRGEDLFEIATFRRDPHPGENLDDLPSGDNLFGSPEEDAFRRDFTINALYYDPVNKKMIDHTKGTEDLSIGIIRVIGDPMVRLEEDPIRILRAIRLAHMIRFGMEPRLRDGISKLSHLLADSALPRRREEILKFLRLDDPSLAFVTCEDLNVLQHLSPQIHELLQTDKFQEFLQMLSQRRVSEDASPTELFSRLLSAYLRCLEDFSYEDKELKKLDVTTNHPLIALMRDQLGMFKAEQMMFLRALRMLSGLKKRKDFERKGPGRVKSFVSLESFPLALKLAEYDYLISSEDLQFWKESLSLRDNPDVASRPKRKRRRKRRRKAPFKNKETSSS